MLKSKELLTWYEKNKRDLPWRKGRDPYSVWVSEVMLQQTQVATVVPYYLRWMNRFPSIESLAAAGLDDALALWQGLGYYRRCRNLLEAARVLARDGMPSSRNGWLSVPGVGKYTASAIASICFDEPVGVADGNVQRVFARLAGCGESGALLSSKAQEWADRNVDRQRPGDWNQALMELGATVCTPKEPNCSLCPLAFGCVAKQSWATDRYPAAHKRTPSVRLVRSSWAPYCEGSFGMRRIPEGNWSAGLWEFPYLERAEGTDADIEATWAVSGAQALESLGTFTHAVTHHRIRVEAWLARLADRSDGMTWFDADELAGLAMPSAQRRIAKMAIELLGLALPRSIRI